MKIFNIKTYKSSKKIELNDAFFINLSSSINKQIVKNGFAVISDKNIKKLAEKARMQYQEKLTKFPLKPKNQKFSRLEIEKKPYRKLNIGASNGVGHSVAQFVQSTYFSCNSSDLRYLADLSKILIKIRNLTAGLQINFGNDPLKDNFWNASRVHHYPSGGGFMSRHTDKYFAKVMEKNKIPFLQIMLLLSKKGEDFSSGGGYLIPRGSSEILYLEEQFTFGDIIIFDGRIEHGVDTVDTHKIPDFESHSGRTSLMLGLYETI